MPEFGFDSLSVWYVRAVALFQWSRDPEWPGYWSALRDPEFLGSFACTRCNSYPWLVSTIYWGVMELSGSADPIYLQGLHVLLWLLIAFLYFRVWPNVPRWLWVLFAFAPISGWLLTFLYAEHWMLAGLLGLILALRNRLWAVAFLLTFLLCLIKRESALQASCIIVSFAPLNWHERDNRFALTPGIAFLGLGLYLFWIRTYTPPIAQRYENLSILAQLGELRTYTFRTWRIPGYYLDVMFRPRYWVLIWPLSFWMLWQGRRTIRWAVLPLLAIICGAIPLIFFQAHEGAYREVVLNGAKSVATNFAPALVACLARAFPAQRQS